MSKATHLGHCQICERQQMLPNGHLSKHGYTVDFGYFNGVCQGAGELPYEISRDYIPGVIEGAKKYIELRRAVLKVTKTPVAPGTTTAWYAVPRYVGNSWEQVEIRPSEGRVDLFQYYNTGKQEWLTVRFYGKFPKTVEECANFMNDGYASHIEGEISGTKRTLDRLQARYDNWEPGEIKERGAA